VRTVKLGSLCSIQSGGTPLRKEKLSFGGGIPWAKIGDLEATDGIVQRTEESLTEAGLKALGGRLFPSGTVLLAMYGSVGKVALAGTPLTTNQAILGIQVADPDVLSPEYLRRWLESIRQELVFAARGVTQQNISATLVRDLQIPLPAVAEQRRIAAMLDKADAIQRNQQERIRLLNELLRSAFLELFDDPVRNGKGWPTERLGELALFVGGGTPSRAIAEFFTGPIPWASSKDITTENLVDTQEHVTSEAVEQSATRIVPPGSILVVVKSKILLHRLPVAITRAPVCFSQDIKAITLRDNRLPVSYLARHLRIGQQALLSKARGANTEGLTLDHLRDYRVMLPPTDLLHRWDGVETTIRSLHESFAEHQAAATSLLGALAERAFGMRSGQAR
jgi:type I restriction enzyme, S subunit